ncbi:MAG: ATP-dependent DNA helicase PcrA [Deltaproteobacteria bacterium]|nr:MAG: ATP-dependent DNA helicase PcrA [Deltaproteobacteria bacterium]
METPDYPLNPQQLEAVKQTEGPLMIFAGAGSGKTRTLTYRFAHIIQSKRAHPTEILAVTFTNKAAREMRERIVSITRIRARRLFVSTFHAFCLWMLRSYGDKGGIDPKFSILDDGDTKRLMNTIFKEMSINSRFLTPRRALWEIQHAKAHGIPPENYTYGSYDLIGKRISEIYEAYERHLKTLNAMDFSDLLLNAYRLLMHSPGTLAHFRQAFRYVMVDEYQDTNFIQYQIIKQLAWEHRNLCVVGDDDQSIYSWRGANKENIRLFHEDFPEATVIKLEQNYRSTKTILHCASHLIRHNSTRTEKTLWTENDTGDPVVLYEAGDEEDEARWVIEKIQDLSASGFPWHSFAVFYRTNAQSRVFEERLIRSGIPYQIFGGFKFYDRKEIKDLLAYLKCLVNPGDELAVRRAVAAPSRGIGKGTLDQIKTFSITHNLPFLEAMGKISEDPAFKMRKRVRPFYDWLMEIRSLTAEMEISEILEKIVKESGYLTPYEGSSDPRAQSIIENVQELISAVANYEEEADSPSLEEFLDLVSLMTDTDTLNETSGKVTLMTLHSAKGLEFPVVFITGLEEGLFPHERSLVDEGKVDEERRLFYVGITRSQKRLFLSFCRERYQYGRASFRPRSRFLRELPEDILQGTPKRKSASLHGSHSPFASTKLSTGATAPPNTRSEAGNNGNDFKVGEQVIHPVFGRGIIKVRELGNTHPKLLIHFEGIGLKLIYPKFVELTRI